RQRDTVLTRPKPLIAEPSGPGQQRPVRSSDGHFVEHPSRLVDGDSRQRVLVHVHSDHDHGDRLLQRWGRPASGQASIEAAARLLSGHARRSREGGGDTTLASQLSGDMRESGQPPPPESAPISGRRHQARMTLSSGMSADAGRRWAIIEGMNEQLTDGPRPPDSVVSPPEQRVSGLIPFVHVEDVERSIAFYYHLGFIVASVYKYRGRPVWAELRSEGAELMVS